MKSVFIVTDYPIEYEDGYVVDVCDTMEVAEKTKALFPNSMISEKETNRYKNHPVGKYYELTFENDEENDISIQTQVCSPCVEKRFSFCGDYNDDLCYYVKTIVFVGEDESLENTKQQTEKFVKENIFDKKLTAEQAEAIYSKEK